MGETPKDGLSAASSMHQSLLNKVLRRSLLMIHPLLSRYHFDCHEPKIYSVLFLTVLISILMQYFCCQRGTGA